jgi:hypothetical protein
MAFSASDELRIQAIEKAVNDLQTALNALATKAQMKQLLNIRQSEIEDLKTRVAALESEIQILQS